jgi:hypothetical protein
MPPEVIRGTNTLWRDGVLLLLMAFFVSTKLPIPESASLIPYPSVAGQC